MEKINPTQNLNQTILFLEQKRAEELQSLQQHYQVVYESIKPFNLMKSALHTMTSSPDLKHNILNTAIGLSTGYLSKKILLGSTHNPVKTILGTVFTICNNEFSC
jgi:hypothetical protein